MSVQSNTEEEILRELWQSSLPISFILSENLINELLPPLYLMLPRHLYLPCFIEKILRYYSASHSNDLWFEYNSKPLKWHYPIGVLYDSLTANLPWEIIVHFDQFPEQDLIRFPNQESIEAHYMSTVKEADALKHKGQMISEMQRRDHKQLWNSLLQDKYQAFWIINRKLMSYTNNLCSFRYIPFRIYLFNRPFIQKLYAPYDHQRRQWLTLRELIEFALNDEIQSERLEDERKILSKNLSDYRVIIHGVQPPLHTSIQWLSEYFSYPDNFLHICLIDKNT